jgi:segregation and condensation protein B
VLYGVSAYFLDYFGINSTEELPQLKEVVAKEENTIGEGE